jgi:glutathione S-transferase
MSLTIYGTPASRAFRVLWAAHELALPFELVPHHYAGPETKGADYLAINPNGTVPAIVDDGVPLFESLAINLYLARKAGRLWPAGIADEGRLYQWTLWAGTEVDPVIGQWAYHTFFLPPEQRKPELAAEGGARLRRRLDVIDGALARRRWLAGDDFTIADLNVAAVLYRAPRFGIDAWPHLADWHARCYARPAAKTAVALREAKAA